ncbi:asparagine synthase [Aquimarina sp. MAR_2010_214]|uniref:asparagine synthase-related protein n=1 Tax=Aquimarina sp. MAR_2010_214 TaxID=1250026 RepID=UPI000C70F48F|nr:asparagine synthase-related protein [Aquimarina sp. MAR_2010_214]PKV48240.1 asparagine synthase [Aquimarina sp. MAR_2010_214]
MISFSINLKDVAHSCIVTSKRWCFKESYIEPFAHQSLESFAITNGRQYLFVVRERNSQEVIKTNENQALRNVCDTEFYQIKKSLTKWSLHYISLLIDKSTITIHTGKWGVAPIYLVESKNTLRGHWNPKEHYKNLSSFQLDKELVSHYLITYYRPYSKKTIFPEMHRLTERSVAQWKGKGTLEIIYPPSVEQPFAKELKPNADVIGMFKEILYHSMKRWVHDDTKTISAELSSGLDSGIVSILASSLISGKLQTYGLLVMDEYKEAQISRRDELITKFGYKDTSIDIEGFLPFSENSYRVTNAEMVPWEGCYHAAFNHLLSLTQQKKDNVLFTGFGGDELFFPYWDEMDEVDKKSYISNAHLSRDKVPLFIKNDLYETYSDTVNSIKRAPKSLMSDSSIEAVAYGSPVYLTNNIWPVSPYCTPELINFCRSLPFSWRKNRRLQREFLTQHGCSRKISHPKQSEDFGPVMSHALQQSSIKVDNLFKNSCLADMGYIEPKRFISAYHKHINNRQRSKYSNIDFYTVIALEYTMYSLFTKQNENLVMI